MSSGSVSGRSVSVNWATSNGTAVEPGDYTAASGTVTFFPGQVTKTVSVPVVGDALDEDDETFTVTLSAGLNAIIADGSGVATIVDDDPLPGVSIGDVSVTEGDAGSVAASFTVSLGAPSGRSVSVDWASANGTALAPGDYAAGSGTVSFAAGETSKTVSVQVAGDTLDEYDQVFSVVLSGAVNATITDGTGAATIIERV